MLTDRERKWWWINEYTDPLIGKDLTWTTHEWISHLNSLHVGPMDVTNQEVLIAAFEVLDE